MDSLGYQGVSLEGLKLKRGDLTLGHVSKDRADVCFVAIDARSMVFQGWKTLFPENFPCLCIRSNLEPEARERVRGGASCVYVHPVFHLPIQRYSLRYANRPSPISTSHRACKKRCRSRRQACRHSALCYLCGNDASVLCLLSMGHLCLPFANLGAEMLTSWPTTSAYCGKTQKSANTVFSDGCIVQQNRAKDNRTSMIVCNIS